MGAAYDSFHSIGLQRDEARVLRELIRVAIDQEQPRETVDAMTKRFLEIDGRIEAGDRAKAADDFDARLKYAQSEFDVLRLKDEAVLARERELALAQRNRQSQLLSFLAAMMLLVLGGFLLLQRRSNRRLEATMVLLRESEARAHDLLNLGAGFVFLHDLEGRLLLVNPAAAQVLGLPADKLAGRFLQEFQPKGSREAFGAYLQRLQAVGQV